MALENGDLDKIVNAVSNSGSMVELKTTLNFMREAQDSLKDSLDSSIVKQDELWATHHKYHDRRQQERNRELSTVKSVAYDAREKSNNTSKLLFWLLGILGSISTAAILYLLMGK